MSPRAIRADLAPHQAVKIAAHLEIPPFISAARLPIRITFQPGRESGSIPIAIQTTMKNTLFLLAVLATTLTGQAAVKPTEEAAASFPPIWEKAGPRERLKAVRAAELDGDRLLIERVYGMKVDANTTVNDLALDNDQIGNAVRATLVGAINVGEPEYLADGQVQVVRAVKIQEIIETLERAMKRKILSDGSMKTVSDTSNTTRKVNDKVIDVMGNAALPGSEGHAKVMAKRAAELDAYRRLAGRMMGVTISGTTTVKDFCLDNDKVVAALSQTLKAATPTAIKYKSDGSCAVTMEIKVADIIRTTRRLMNASGEKTEIKDEIETRTFSETGMGTMHPVGETKKEETVTETSGNSSDPFFETKVVIKQVVQSTPVVQ